MKTATARNLKRGEFINIGSQSGVIDKIFEDSKNIKIYLEKIEQPFVFKKDTKVTTKLIKSDDVIKIA